MFKTFLLSCLICLLAACATTHSPSPRVMSELQQGKRFFQTGYYKHAMGMLLPLACEGNAEAQYAVGYMYYYGYGVAQDTTVGTFWIERSASQHFQPAKEALATMLLSKSGTPKQRYR